jgi:hypothetical protein
VPCSRSVPGSRLSFDVSLAATVFRQRLREHFSLLDRRAQGIFEAKRILPFEGVIAGRAKLRVQERLDGVGLVQAPGELDLEGFNLLAGQAGLEPAAGAVSLFLLRRERARAYRESRHKEVL